MRIAYIVEGHGEVRAVPILLRRLVNALDPTHVLQVEPPIRTPKSKLLQAGELERVVELAARKIGGTGAILILLDSDEDCPAELGPDLLARARAARSDVPSSVVLAKQEFEAWFLAAAESLRDRRGLRNDLEIPAQPESVRGAKEWLTKHMTGSQHYVETLDQPALAEVFDLAAARRADSFDKCWREVERLIVGTRAGASADRCQRQCWREVERLIVGTAVDNGRSTEGSRGEVPV